MLSLMNAQAYGQCYKSLESKDLAAIIEKSIYSMFELLHNDKGRCLIMGGGNVLSRFSEITKPTILGVSARKSLSVIWLVTIIRADR